MFKWYYSSYRLGASARGIKWSLGLVEFIGLCSSDCYFCGAEPSMRKKHKDARRPSLIVNGIDRIDNYDAYSSANSVPSCPMCNRAKNNKDAGEFLGWVKRVHDHSVRSRVTVAPKRYRLLISGNYSKTDRAI